MSTKTKSHTDFLRDPDLPFLEARDSHIFGRPFGLHSHPTYCLSVVESGSTLCSCRGGLWLMKPGSAVYLPPGEPHACNPRPGEELRYRMYYFERTWFEAMLAGRGRPRSLDASRPAILDDPQVADAFLRFGKALAGRVPAALPSAKEKLGLLQSALDMLLDSPQAGPLFGGRPRAEHRAARLAARSMAERPAERISLGELAEVAGVTPCHLTRIFRRALGMTPHAYQNQLRVELAKKLLAQGAPIAGVAVEAGFTDQSHLNRVFRRFAGATPGQYALACRR